MRYLLLLACWLTATLCKAQATRIESLSVEDGLSAGSVLCVYRDDQGYVYMGTLVGIDRYDGTHIVNIGYPDPQMSQRHDCSVNTLAGETQRTLLAGGKQGLWRLDKATLRMTRLHAADIDCEVTDLLPAGRDRFYIGTVKGLFLMDHGRLTQIALGPEEQRQSVVDVCLLPTKQDTALCVAMTHGVVTMSTKDPARLPHYSPCRIDGRQMRITAIAPIPKTDSIAVGTATDGVLACAAADTAYRQYLLPATPINMLAGDEATQHLLIATNTKGAFEIDPATLATVRQYSNSAGSGADRIRFESTLTFYRDNTGIDWLTYKFFGVDHTFLNRHIFHTYNVPGLFDTGTVNVRSFLLDGRRKLLGTRDGLYIIDPEHDTTVHHDAAQLGASIVAAIQRSGDKYLIGTVGNGLHAISTTTLQEVPFAPANTLQHSNIYYMDTGADGRVWICSSAGLACYDPAGDTMRLFTTANSQLPDNEVLRLAIEPSGRIWVATYTALCCYDPVEQTLTTSRIPQQLKDLGQVEVISDMGDGTMIFGPNFGQPVAYNMATGRVSTPQLAEGRNLSYMKFAMHIGQGDSLTLLCNDYGLMLAANGTARRLYGYADGLTNMQFQPGACCMTGDTLWMGTNGGLVWATVGELLRTQWQQLPIIVTDAATDHWLTEEETNAVNIGGKLRLSRWSGDLTLRFAPLLFANNKAVEFVYRLEGHDKEWQKAASDNTVFYHSLSTGTYTLHIKAVGMPEVSGTLTIDVPLRYSAMLNMVALLLLIALIAHIAYCHIKKKPYLWQRFGPKPVKYNRNRVDSDAGRQIADRLKKLMDEKKPYTDPNLQMADLAQAVECSAHTLSQVFSQTLGVSYYDFVSEYRIREFTRLAQLPEYNNYTINALSEACGFRSRTTFVTAFKKVMGTTPKEYMKQLNKRY